MKTNHKPFSLYRKTLGGGRFWYARFWDYAQRRYNSDRALGVAVGGVKERRGEAEKAAYDLLPSVTNWPQGVGFLKYLRDFWSPGSPHFRELELSRGKPLSGGYISGARDIMRLHIEPYPPFKSLVFRSLSPAAVRDFMAWEARRGTSGDRINRALQVIRIAVRYALENGDLEADPLRGVKKAYHEALEKGVLAAGELGRLVYSPCAENRARRRLAVLLGALCGMRLGEARGLHWEDIGLDAQTLSVRHNWQNLDGLKGPKYDSVRTVPLPPPVPQFLEAVRKIEGFPEEGLVFRGQNKGKPCGVTYFRNALIAELEETGISREEQARRNLTFHGLRHTFVSLGRLSGLNDFAVQGLAGHKCSQSMNKYSHARQVVDPNACLHVFGNFLGKL